MALKLMYITNDSSLAQMAQRSGVDRIWIDLEYLGKEERQKGLDTVKSKHTVEDICRLRPMIDKSELMVRINPLNPQSPKEIDRVIAAGADLIMLPFFHSSSEVQNFIKLVNGRARTMLLLETKEAYESLEDIVTIPGIDEVHVGLNDLHLSYGMRFMFEPLANGMLDRVCHILKKASIPYGFGGIAKIGEGVLPAELIIGEHYRLGSTMTILSRTFLNPKQSLLDDDYVEKMFAEEVLRIRQYESSLLNKNHQFFVNNQQLVRERVRHIVDLKEREKIK